MSTKTRFRQALKKTIQPQTGWLDIFAAMIGKADGTIATDVSGVIWVRNILNGQELRVHNSNVPNTLNMQVEVGRRVETPNLWQIKGARDSFSAPAESGYVPFHFQQHVFPNADSGLFPRKQIRELTVLVADADAFIVQVYGGTFRTRQGAALVENQQRDLSGYIPTGGAVYVNIEANENGELRENVGRLFAAKQLATVIDFPKMEAGYRCIATIILYESMAALLNEHILIPMPLEVNAADFAEAHHTHINDDYLLSQISKAKALKIYPNTNFM